MYSSNATLHDVITDVVPNSIDAKVLYELKDSLRHKIALSMRIRKKNRLILEALPDQGPPDLDVFWIDQRQDQEFDMLSWNQGAYPDFRLDGQIALARLTAADREFICKNGYIYFNYSSYTTEGTFLPSNSISPAKMTLSRDGNLLYFTRQIYQPPKWLRWLDGSMDTVEVMTEYLHADVQERY